LNFLPENLDSLELLAKVRNLPFDRLRVNGLRLKLFSSSVRGELGEPQQNTFARCSLKSLKDRKPVETTHLNFIKIEHLNTFSIVWKQRRYSRNRNHIKDKSAYNHQG
jgi:hypothetical protein